MAAANLLCSLCGRRTPTFYCSCLGSKVNLCDVCLEPHRQKHPALKHPMFPLGIDVPDLTKYLQGEERFFAGKAELEQTLTKIDQCCFELTEAVNSVVAKLYWYRDNCVGQLQAWKTSLSVEIAEAVGEVQAVLSGGQAEFRSRFSRSLKDFEPGYFNLFNFAVDTSQIECYIPSILRTEYCESQQSQESSLESFPGHVIPVIKRGVLECFDVQTRQTTSHSLFVNFHSGIMLCFIDANTLLVTGGGGNIVGAVDDAYFITLSNAKVTPTASMNNARYEHGIIKHRDFVYVFGGVSGTCLASCEKFSLAQQAWILLPAMITSTMDSQKNRFTPCSFGDDIYLPCVKKEMQAQLEVFNVQTEQFKTLPTRLSMCGYASISIIVQGEMIIIFDSTSGGSQMGRWRVNAKEGFKVYSLRNRVIAFSCTPPVCRGEDIFWAFGELRSLRLDS